MLKSTSSLIISLSQHSWAFLKKYNFPDCDWLQLRLFFWLLVNRFFLGRASSALVECSRFNALITWLSPRLFFWAHEWRCVLVLLSGSTTQHRFKKTSILFCASLCGSYFHIIHAVKLGCALAWRGRWVQKYFVKNESCINTLFCTCWLFSHRATSLRHIFECF